MQCIVLCAGFATRLHPLTLHQPKQLLPLGSKCILDHLMERLSETHIRSAVLACNHRFIRQFGKWLNHQSSPLRVQLIDNGVCRPDQRLGSVGDLHLALEKMDIQEDFLVLHGDNLFTFPLNPALDAFHRQGNTLAIYDVHDMDRAKRAGQAVSNDKGQIVSFVEKPHKPAGTKVSIGIYMLQAGIRDFIKEYVTLGLPADRSGDLMAWLHRRTALFTHCFSPGSGIWFDIGTPIDYRQARRHFAEL